MDPPPSTYTDTFILEANRRHSAQFTLDQPNETEATGNWVNKVNAGLKLDVGDQVTVHSAMVSDLGAEDATIEFKGKEIAPIGAQTYTESVASFPNDDEIVRADDILPFAHPTEVYTDTQTTNPLPLRDNEAKVELNFYKNSNAEFHITLPQMWSNLVSSPNGGWSLDCGRGNLETPASVATLTTGYGQVAVSPGIDRRCIADWNSYGGYEVLDFDRLAHGAGVGEPRSEKFTNTQLKLDNSRFMLWVRKLTYNYKTNVDPTENSLTKLIDLAVRDPALADYIPYSQLLDINIPIGFNAPSEVASVITETYNKLRDTSDITARYLSDGTRYPPIPANTPVREVISQKQESNALRLINCATPYTNTMTNASNYFGNTTTPSNASFDPIASYLSGYQFVGFKRPDFVQLGRVLAKLSPSTYKVGDARFDEMRSCLDDSGMILGEPGEEPGWRQDAYTYNYVPVVTSIEYTKENLEKFMDWFVCQGNYPELFELGNDSVYKFENHGVGTSAHQYYGHGDWITIDTHRFVHLNRYDNTVRAGNQAQPAQNVAVNPSATPTAVTAPDALGTENGCAFGWDGYQTNNVYRTGVAADLRDYTSVPLFIRFNKDEVNNRNFYKDGNFRFETAPPDFKDLYGGIMMRGLHRSTGLYDRIAFLAQVPDQYCTLETGGTIVQYPANATNKWMAGDNSHYSNRKIGYDKHFSAYGNAAMMLYNGVGCSETDFGKTGLVANYLKATQIQKIADKWNLHYTRFINQIYVGANAPLINFNTTKSRFEISDFHTPEKVGDPSGVGFTLDTSTYLGVAQAGELLGKSIYEINKRPLGTFFCPNVAPYGGIHLTYEGKTASPTYGTLTSISPTFNPAIEPYVVFDANSGILIKDWGIPKQYWADCLWGVMGFSWRQLNPSKEGVVGNINTRITSTTEGNLSYITTNCDFISSDMMGNTVNFLSNNLYKPSILTPPQTLVYEQSGTTKYTVNPVITGVAESATITAAHLPTKTIRPYYTIRSDILQDSYYFGSKDQFSLAPVIAIVDKMNQYGDFFYHQSNQLIFTVTNPITITEIKTQVCDPDGDLAQISPNSVVLYKIIKKNDARHDIGQQIQEASKK